MDAERRRMMMGAAGIAGAAPIGALLAGAARAGAAQSHGPRSTVTAQPLALSGAALMNAVMKLKASTDERITIGWVDAVNYGFIEGEAIPLYRLYAATWQRFVQRSDTLFEGRLVEVAYFVDMRSGELLEKLTMPRTGRVVDVPRYRAGPTPSRVMPERRETRKFDMAHERPDSGTFFMQGTAASEQYFSQPERRGDRIAIREDNGSRLVRPDGSPGAFHYREWVIWNGDYAEVMDPATRCVQVEIAYSATTAWRPWMQMGTTPGNTLQNGWGGKALRPEDLPPDHLRLTQRFHPDLLDDPARALGA
jgi:hypothetical protein